MTIIHLQPNQFHIVIELTKKIWPVAYSDILSEAQLHYMIETFYTETALLKVCIENHHVFCAAMDENENPIGFVSYQLNAHEKQTKIHKLYVLPEMQGTGLGKKMIEFVTKIALKNQQNALFLNVNKHNKAQNFYSKLGFKIIKEEVIPIGNDYVMDDYVMQKLL